MAAYSKYQFALFRIIFGSYLALHFAYLIPWVDDIWSNQGVLADPTLNFTYGAFPNPLWLWDAPIVVTLFVTALFVASIFMVLGYFRRSASLFLWFGWACLFHRNNLISNPGIPMVGWLLLACALIPKGEAWSLKRTDTIAPQWALPKELFWGAWIIAGVAYTLSGIDKAMAPSWRDGTAIIHLLNNPLARDYFWVDLLAALPMWVHKLLTWSTLALEIGFGVLCFFRKTRLFAWLAIMALHLGILTVIDFADLTFGVILLHLFTIEPRWFINAGQETKNKIVFFDGVCGLCNQTVNTLIGMDSARQLRFSPLQGKAAAHTLPEDLRAELDSIAYLRGSEIYTRSTAVLYMLRDLGGIWYFTSFALWIPKPLRDVLYNWVARNRYRWFGKESACRLPSPEERALFLD